MHVEYFALIALIGFKHSFSLHLILLAWIPGLGPSLVLTSQSVPHSSSTASIAATEHAVTRTVTHVVTDVVTEIVSQVTNLMINHSNNRVKVAF